MLKRMLRVHMEMQLRRTLFRNSLFKQSCTFGVWSVKCKVWSVERKVQSVKCGVRSAKRKVRSVKCRVWSVKCGYGI